MTKSLKTSRLTPLTLALMGALGGTALSSTAFAYQLGQGDTATVLPHESIKQIDKCSAASTGNADAGFCLDPKWSELSPVRATPNRAGNAVRLIWYGNPNDKDGKVPQTGFINEGLVEGHVQLVAGVNLHDSEKGERNEKGMALSEGLGNAFDAYGWSANKNPNDVNIHLKTLDNRGVGTGKAELQAGQSDVYSMAMGTVSGNGISIYATTDFGDATQLVGDGIAASSSTGGYTRASVSGGSGAVRVRPRSAKVASQATGKVRGKRSVPSMSESVAVRSASTSSLGNDLDQWLRKPNNNDTSSKPSSSGGLFNFDNLIGSNADWRQKQPSENDKKPTTTGPSVTSGAGSSTVSTTGGTNVATSTPAPTTPPEMPSIKPDHNYYGKSMSVLVERIDNSGTLTGEFRALGHPNANTLEDNRLQYMPSVGIGSGNGIAIRSHVWTDDNTSQSIDKLNSTKLEAFRNTGVIAGVAEIRSGQTLTSSINGHSYVRAFNVGNAVEVSAITQGQARHTTNAEISHVFNSGLMDGKVTLTAMGNESYDKENVYKFVQSSVESKGNGNGLGVHAVTESTHRGTKAILGDVVNYGRMSGQASLETKNGTGDISINAYGTANGISVLFSTAQNASLSLNSSGMVEKKPHEGDEAKMGTVDNHGLVVGHLLAKPGTVLGTNKTADGPYEHAEEEVKVLVSSATYPLLSYFDSVRQTPPTPKDNVYTGPRVSETSVKKEGRSMSINNSNAKGEIWASGNGISLLASRKADGRPAPMMDTIKNSGVISGFARMFHGFEGDTRNDRFARVDYLGVGSGIFLNGKLVKPIENTGIISGNVSALMMQGSRTRPGSQMVFHPGAEKDSIQNYGLMAGTLIAGHYIKESYSSVDVNQAYEFYEDALPQDQNPLVNSGTLVYLKKGLGGKDPKNYDFESQPLIRMKDAETIEKIVVAPNKDVTIGEKTYHLVNAPLMASKLDSSFTATEATVDQHIINGVGVEKGALHVTKDLTLTNSIINGFVNAVKVDGPVSLTLENTTLNANGFDVRIKKGNGFDTVKPAAISSSTGQTLVLKSGTIINGDIALQGGNNTIVWASNNVHLNGKVNDFGWEGNTLQIGEVPNFDGEPLVFTPKVEGLIDTVKVNQPAELARSSQFQLGSDIYLNAPLTVHGNTVLGGTVLTIHLDDLNKVPVFAVKDGFLDMAGATLKVDFDRKKMARLAKKSGGLKPLVLLEAVMPEETVSGYSEPELSRSRRSRRSLDERASETSTTSPIRGLDAMTKIGLGKDDKLDLLGEEGKKAIKDAIAKLPAGTSSTIAEVIEADGSSDLAGHLQEVADQGSEAIQNAILQTQPLLTGSVAPMLERVILGAQDDVKMNLLTVKPTDEKHVWAHADGVYGSRSARTGLSGYRADSKRVTLGADMPVGASTRVGAMLGWATTKAHSKEFVVDHTVKAQSFMGSVFVDHRFTPSIVVQGHAGLAHSSIKGDRVIPGEDPVTIKSKYSMDTVFASALLGMPWQVNQGQFIPFVDTNVWMTREGAYSETGAGTLALNVQKKTTTNADLGMGLKAQLAMTPSFNLEALTRVGYRLTNPSHEVSARYNQDGAPIFTVKSAEKGRISGQVGFNATWSLTKAASVALQYDASLARGFVGQEVGLHFRVKF